MFGVPPGSTQTSWNGGREKEEATVHGLLQTGSKADG